MTYNVKAPKEIETTEIKVPIHLPNKIPEIINIGDPNPSNVTQTIENIKKYQGSRQERFNLPYREDWVHLLMFYQCIIFQLFMGGCRVYTDASII